MSNLNFLVAFVLVMVIIIEFKSIKGNRVLKRRQDAVVSLVGSQNFYVEMKRKIPLTYVDDGQLGQLRDYDYSGESDIDYEKFKNLDPPITFEVPAERGQSMDLNDKSIICSFVFDSPFFAARGEVAVNYDLTQTETLNELRESKRDTYNDIYGSYPNAHGQWLNPYKRRFVSVGGDHFEEHTFRCLTRRRDSSTAAADSYVDYFVSPIYQSKSPRDLIMNGRFVFTSNEANELILFATAEERVSIMSVDYIEKVHTFYYNKNKDTDTEYPKPDEASNVLCTLPVRDKIRLCDSVLNLPDFPDKVTFLPNEANVKDKCEEIRVLGQVKVYRPVPSFRRGFDHVTTKFDITYDQWMVGCNVVGTSDNSSAPSSWYYISLGIDSYSVMVFKESATQNGHSGLVGVHSIYWAECKGSIVPISSKVTDEPSRSNDWRAYVE